MINETAQVILETTKGEIYNEVVITTWIIVLAIFGVVAWINSWNKRKTNWVNFWKIFGWTAAISGAIVTIFIMSPTTISAIINWINEFIGI